MKTYLFFTFGILFLCLSMVSFSNPVEKKTKKGKILNMEIVSAGNVNLYKVDIEVLKPLIPADPMESYTEVHTEYYIGKQNENNVVKITTTNYKKLLLSHMTSNHEVTTMIGSKGYKFVDVEGIFMAYNEQ